MKKLFIALLAGVVAMATCGCIRITINIPTGKETEAETETEQVYTGDAMDFNYIKLTESGSMATVTVYYAEKTDTGVHLEYYEAWSHWDNEAGTSVEDKYMIRELDGGEDLYNEIAQLAGAAGVPSWDGFSGSDPNVMDGYGFNLEAELPDGSSIYASGSNKFPDGYQLLAGGLDHICSDELLEGTEFHAGKVQLTLPGSWAGEISANHRSGVISFEMPVDGQSQYMMCLYTEPYPYEGEDYIQLGTYEDELHGTMYVSIKKMDHAGREYDNMTDTQKAIWDALDDDMQKIAESVVYTD